MSLLRTLRLVLAPPHRTAAPFLAAGVGVAVAGLFWGHGLVWLGLAFAGFCLFFFRDPERVPPDRPGVILAAADGHVVAIDEAPPPAALGLGDDPRPRIATFLSILDVHVNRVPATGEVTAIAYRPGRFLDANDPRAGEANEHNAIALRLPDGRTMAVVQVAGLVARRIHCDLRPGDRVAAGQRLGIIRFGSRTDLYLPHGMVPLVRTGQTMIGGETVMAAEAPAPEPLP
jgi:phosphatidylserine decarboxylase